MNLTEMDKIWVSETVEKIKNKMYAVTERNVDKIPYTTKDGVFDDRSDKDNISWWTNGFWGGIMWQMFSLTGEKLYEETAKSLRRNWMWS